MPIGFVLIDALAQLRFIGLAHFAHRLLFLLILALLSLLCSTSAIANPLYKAAPYARHMQMVDGINITEINEIMQDSRGYLWLATGEGLIRYDGSNAKKYSHDKSDPTSISNDIVYGIVEDQNGNVWVATYGGGINKFDPVNDTFSQVPVDLYDQNKPHNNQFYRLSIDRENTLWIGSRVGAFRIDVDSEKTLPREGILADLPTSVLLGIFIDKQNRRWLSNDSGGLTMFDGNKIYHFVHDPDDPTTISNDRIRNLHQDKFGQVWIATSRGLNKFNDESFSFSHYMPEYAEGFNVMDNDIYSVQSDDSGRLWIGSVINGIFSFEPDSQIFTKMSGNIDLNGQYKPNRVNMIYKDRQGNLWFGLKSGITLMPKTAQDIEFLTVNQGNFRVFDVKRLGPDKIGLSGDFKYFELTPSDMASEQKYTSMVRPYRINQTEQGDIWFTTLGDHVQFVDRQTDQISRFKREDFSGDKPFPVASVESFFDNNGFLWFTPLTDKGGLVKLDTKDNSFTTVAQQPMFYSKLRLDEENWLLLSSTFGLYHLNTTTHALKPWARDLKNQPDNLVTMYMDEDKTLWIGTDYQGLVKLPKGAKAFEKFDSSHGLVSDGVMSIIEDDNDNLWLGTQVGLVRFNKKTAEVQNFEHHDGLLFTEFNKRTAARLDDGRLVFGHNSGLMIFDPKQLAGQNQNANVVINQFKLLNQTVEVQSKDPSSPLLKPIAYSEKLQLSYEDYVFSFGFSGMNLLRPDKMQYAYKLEGLDEQWLYTDASNRWAGYTTLPAKDYLFKVKARYGSGPWSEPTTLQLTITPPWWLTLWAKVSYVLIAVVSIFGFVRHRTQKLQQHAKELEERVTERTAQLKERTDELAEKSDTVTKLLAQKQRMFASISHEFRTPLTLILSPVDSLLRQYGNQPWSKELLPLKRNGQRLLRMVDQLLEFAKLEQNIEQQHETISLKQTLLIICESFNKLVEAKQLTLEVRPFDDVNLTVIHDSLNKILLNLISNAVKYTPSKGTINIVVTNDGEQVFIIVKDNGIGIAKDDQKRVFERFNRATQNHGEAIVGTGIGLALVKELVETNGGEITLTSELGQGSTFAVTLPISTQTQVEEVQIAPQSLILEVESIAYGNEAIKPQQPIKELKSDCKTILIIDDNSDIRTLLQNQLEQQYNCLLANNGKKGLDIATEHLPDLILSDVMMPVMDGFEFAEKLKAEPITSHIPLILLTAKGSAQNRIKGLKLLIDDYLTKPFNMEELKQRIYNTLTIRDNLRKSYAKHVENNAELSQLQQLGMNKVDQGFVDLVYKQLDVHYKDTDFGVKSLHQELCVSERQLHRKLKALLDLAPSELLRNFRLNKALELLQEGKRVSDIYLEVGFSSHSYFTSCFKAKHGKTPKAYQQQLS